MIKSNLGRKGFISLRLRGNNLSLREVKTGIETEDIEESCLLAVFMECSVCFRIHSRTTVNGDRSFISRLLIPE